MRQRRPALTLSGVFHAMGVATTVAAWTAALLVVAATLPASFGYAVHPVVSGSMEPAIPVGAVVLVQRDRAPLAEGEVITFVRDDGELITHRIQAAVMGSAVPAFRTKGDANPVADRQVVQQANVEGRVTAVVPGVGYIIMAANSLWYRNLMVSYSLVMVTAYLVRRIWALGRLRTCGAGQLAAA